MRILSILAVTVSLTTFACASGRSESGSAQSALSTQPIGQNVEGPAKRVADALSTVALRADQRVEIEKLLAQASARHIEARKEGPAPGAFAGVLAAQVEKGTIDRAALTVALAEGRAKYEAEMTANRADLGKLHALLTPEQRSQFVETIKTQFMNGPGGEHGPRGEHEREDGPRGEHEHGPRGEHGHDDGPRGEHEHGEHGDGAHGDRGPMMGGGLFRELNLDAAQRDKLKEAMRETFREARAQGGGGLAKMRAGLESFKGDSFDPSALVQAHPHPGEHMISMAEKVVPILTPEQRVTLAARLREHSRK